MRSNTSATRSSPQYARSMFFDGIWNLSVLWPLHRGHPGPDAPPIERPRKGV